MEQQIRWSVVACSLILATACGDDGSSADGTAGVSPTAGTTAAVPATGGTGVAGTVVAGLSTTGGTGAGTAAPAPEPVPCGANTCMPITLPIPLPLPAPCCADPAAGTCGTTATDGSCTPPPMSDPRCPDGSSPLGALPSCCAEDTNLCGIQDTIAGMGCIDLVQIGSSPFGAFLTLPNPVTCDGQPVTVPDAGTVGGGDDAGI